MLARSLRRAGGDQKLHSLQMSNPATAEYFNSCNMLTHVHHHKEYPYKKQRLGWAAWSPPHYEPFATFEHTTPCRHFNRWYMGSEHGAGHFAFPRPGTWTVGMFMRHWLKSLNFIGIVGVPLSLFDWWWRMHRNGWEWLNKGAVIGSD